MTETSVKLTELSLGEVVDDRVVMVKKQPWMSPLADDWILVAVMDEDVVYVVEIDAMFVHIGQAEQKWGICRHNSKQDSTKRCLDLNISDRDTLWIISKSNSVTSSG
jgi:hypothetical protein